MIYILLYLLSYATINSPCERLLIHKSYVSCYDTCNNSLYWSEYLLTREHVKSHLWKRVRFSPDPDMVYSPIASQYNASGYDRGHNVNAYDMSFDSTSEAESFYMSNMSPQLPSFNRGIWHKLENYVRQYALLYDSTVVITGNVYLTDERLKSGIPVPNECYKVLYRMSDSTATCFLLNNEGSNKQLFDFIIPLDSLEKVTHIKFLNFIDHDCLK